MSDVPKRFQVDLTGATLLGRYEVESLLSESGGMGLVFLARDTRLDLPVVVKVPRGELLAQSGFRMRFDSEIRKLCQVKHPNVTRILDLGEHDELPFFVLEHLGGGDLGERNDARWQQEGPLPSVAEQMAWLQPIARTLDHLHASDPPIVHRDVKPGNILFHEQEDVPYLSDFGIAKVVGSSGATTRVAGSGLSPAFAAPEQCRGMAVDGRTDQYALAGTVYYALTRHVPFELPADADAVTTAFVKLENEPRPLTSFRPDLGESVEAVLTQALSKEVAKRYDTCVAFVSGLAEASEDVVVAGAPASAGPHAPTVFPAAAGSAAAGGTAATRLPERAPTPPTVASPNASPNTPAPTPRPRSTARPKRPTTKRTAESVAKRPWFLPAMVLLLAGAVFGGLAATGVFEAGPEPQPGAPAPPPDPTPTPEPDPEPTPEPPVSDVPDEPDPPAPLVLSFGELPAFTNQAVRVRVSAPGWVAAGRPTLLVNGEEAPPVADEDAVYVELEPPPQDGNWTITAAFEDDRAATIEHHLVVDRIKPVIEIEGAIEEADGLRVQVAPDAVQKRGNETWATVSGAVDEANLSALGISTVNGTKKIRTESDGSFRYDLRISSENDTVVPTFFAADRAGNTARVSVRLETRPSPRLTILDPAPETKISGLAVVVRGTVELDEGEVLMHGLQKITDRSGPFEALVFFDGFGAQVVVLHVRKGGATSGETVAKARVQVRCYERYTDSMFILEAALAQGKRDNKDVLVLVTAPEW